MQRSIFQTLTIGMIIAVVWGYFADLRSGDVDWFIGRVIFVPVFLLLITFVKRRVQVGK